MTHGLRALRWIAHGTSRLGLPQEDCRKSRTQIYLYSPCSLAGSGGRVRTPVINELAHKVPFTKRKEARFVYSPRDAVPIFLCMWSRLGTSLRFSRPGARVQSRRNPCFIPEGYGRLGHCGPC